MITRVIYGSISATADNIATLDVSSVGAALLLGVLWSVSVDTITDNARVEACLSTAAASQFATNNVQDVLSQIAVNHNFVTSGMSLGSIQQFHPIGIKLRTQDRIALHALIAGTIVARAHIITFWR